MRPRSVKLDDDLYSAIVEYSENKEWSIHKTMVKGLESFFLKTSKKPTKSTSKKLATVSNDEPVVSEVWEYWCYTHNAPDEKLSPARIKLIKKSISEHGVDKVKNAILGITRDNWYMNKGLNSINQILKNEENIFKFANNIGANADARFKNIADKSKPKLSPLAEVQQAIKARRGQTGAIDGQVLARNDSDLFD